jgi:hypothetical protein
VPKLDAWTKIGDTVDATGRWTLYKHGGRLISEVERVNDWPDEDTTLARKAFASRVKLVHRGGLWLVAPDGKVALSMWVPARNRLY